MSHNLILAQNNAFNLAQMLMAPVTLFQNDGQFGVMPSAEYDGDEERSLVKAASALPRSFFTSYIYIGMND